MNICVCDDEKIIHDEIERLLKMFLTNDAQFCITDLFSGEALMDYYSNNNKFDIIFLDIEMNQINGIKTAEKIRETDENAIIIFVSSYASYVFEAFRLEALHFIVKPIKQSEFENVFRRALNKYNTINSSISLRWLNERYSIIINDITYIEGYKRHITVHTINEEFEAIGKISEILNALEPHGFTRVHQGFIVNMNYIKRFDVSDVVLRDNTKVMISVRKRTEALKAYDVYLQKWKW